MDDTIKMDDDLWTAIKDSGTAYVTGYSEYIKEFEKQTSLGVDTQSARVEALKAMHAYEIKRLEWLAEQYRAAGDLKSATYFAAEAGASKELIGTLSASHASAASTLKTYASERTRMLAAQVGDSGAVRFLAKNAGSLFDAAELGAALAYGEDKDVAKALGSIVVGRVATSVGGIVAMMAQASPPGRALTIIGFALAGSKGLDALVDEKQWEALGKLGRDAIDSVTSELSGVWAEFLKAFGANIEFNAVSNDRFLAALNLIRRIDPLTLDLDGDGIETLGVDEGVLFDFDGDGVKTGTGWIKRDDGFLVLDRNGNGQIDNGSELFGVDTVKRDGSKARNGFDALADLDSNGDGMFDEKDDMFSSVRVWQDLNHDGIAQANELKTLSEHHIAAIVLKSKEANQDSNGNLISATGSFIRDDGSEGEVNGNQSTAADVDLESNPFYSEHNNKIELDDGARGLPTLQGSGLVRELREAAMLSQELRTLLQSYVATKSPREQHELVGRIIAAWAATGEGFKPFEQRIDELDRDGINFHFAFSWETASKAPTPAQALLRDRLAKLNLLESFNGQAFLEFTVQSMTSSTAKVLVRIGANTVLCTVAVRNGEAVISEADLPIPADPLALLDASYAELAKSIESSLLLQTRLKAYADVVDISLSGDVVAADYRRVIARLADVAAVDPSTAILDAVEFTRSLKTFDVGNLVPLLEDWIKRLTPAQASLLNSELTGLGRLVVDGSSASNLSTGSGHDLILGMGGNDKLYGEDGDDFIWGQDGNDSLYGGNGNDVLIGGAGNDHLEGGDGADTYIFGRGDGEDTIVNSDASGNLHDTLQFRDDIQPSDIFVRRGPSWTENLYLYVRDTKDSIEITNYFSREGNRIAIRFADGSVWTYDDVKSMVLAPTDGNDTLLGYDSDDHLMGGEGDDKLYGNAGNDYLEGGTGIDELHGGDGDDVLYGGPGGAILYGDAGSDTYIFGLGDGNTTINNDDSNVGRRDIIRFRDSVNPGEVTVKRVGTDLEIYMPGGKERLRVLDYFYGSRYRVDEIHFADGSVWTYDDVKPMVLKSTDGNDTLLGYDSDDHLMGGAGDDKLYGNAGNDYLEGGTGIDELHGGDGDDVLYGGPEGAILYGDAGSDTYIFGLGDGNTTINNDDSSVGRHDIIQFREGVAPGEVTVKRVGTDLEIYMPGGKERLRVLDYFYSSRYRVDEIHFADGSVWTYDDVKSMVLAPTDGNDTLLGYDSDDHLMGGEGDDKLYGNAGNDYLEGGTGIDELHGGDGDDVLYGGPGGAILYGDAGSDTYIFGLGDGNTTINNDDSSVGRHDIIRFREGVNPGEVTAKRVGTDLEIYMPGGKERLRVLDYFYSSRYRVDEIHFADGSVWTYDDIKPMVLKSTDGNDTLLGYDSDDHLMGGAGDDKLYGNAGNDYLEGGTGIDELHGGDGDDVLYGGPEGAILYGDAGSDTYIFGLGDGNTTINNDDSSVGRHDVIQFREGVAPGEVTVKRVGTDLEIYMPDGKERLRVLDYFYGSRYRVDEIRFADGTAWSADDVNAMMESPKAFGSLSTDLDRLVASMAFSSAANDGFISSPIPPSLQGDVHWASMAT
ncbi:hypothetical protein KPL74_07985 [Bacillus sp. NP157]|nr:hypothetical protein KPL74_07985 [Bacillus sp. NP157]